MAATSGTTPDRAGDGVGAGGVRWLGDDEQRVWRALTRMLHELPAALDRQLQLEAGLPHTYYLVLAMLSEAPDRELRMTDLARRTATSLSRLSHAVDRLEKQGWVVRQRCPTDRRGQLARLTDSGLAKVVRTAPGHVAEVRRLIFDALSPEQVTQLGAVVEAIVGAATDARDVG